MGQYDVKLQKTSLGYQFDRNVFIGFQTHDNRVVTFKDLKDITVASSGGGGGGGGDLIELRISDIDTVDSSSLGDRLIFRRNNVDEAAFDILPQYVRSAGDANEEQILDSDSKMCLLVPVVQGQATVGYQIYTTDVAVSEWSKIRNRPEFVQNVQLQWGAAATYATQTVVSGSASSTQTYSITLPAVSTLPTLPVSAVSITNTITSHSTDIPTSDAVYNAIQELSPGIGGIATSGSGNAVTALSYSPSDKTLTVISGTTFLTTVTGTSGISVTGEGDSRTISLNASFTNPALTWGAATTYATVNGTTYSITLPAVSTLPTLPVSALNITSSVTDSHSSAIPTEEAVYNFASSAGSLKLKAADSGYLVGTSSQPPSDPETTMTPVGNRFIKWGTTAANVGSASHWINANITGKLNNSLTIGGSLTFDGSNSVSMTFGRGLAWQNNQLSLNASLSNVTLDWGSAVSYGSIDDSSYAISMPPVSTLPTLPVSAVDITTTVTNGSSLKIPTEGAVYNAITTAVPNIVAGTNITTASVSGGISISVSDPFTLNTVTVTSSMIVPTIDSSSNINAAAHKGYVDNVTLTVSSTTVTFTAANGTSTSFDIASSWQQLKTKPTFHDAVLIWGTSTKYVDVPTDSSSTSFSITLPAVSQLPTLSASALDIISSLSPSTQPPASAIPTALAVWNLAHDAGKVQSISIGTHNYTPNSNGVVSLPTYPKSVTLAYGATRTYAKDDDGNDVSIDLPKPGWSDVTGKPTLSISGNTITIGNDSTTWTDTTYTNGAHISIDSNNAINHATMSNVSTTTSGVYKIKVDKYGHISSRSAEITAMPASDVYDWAKASVKPSYDWGEIGDKPTTFPPSSHTHANFSIQIGNSTTTYNGGTAQSIVLATLPTLSVSTMDVITSLSSSASDSQVATAKAIWSALGGKPFNQLYSWDASSGTLLIDIS